MKGMWCGWISGTLAVVLWAGGLLGGSFSTTPGGRTVYDVSQVGGGPDTVSVTADESEVEATDSTAHPEAGNPGTMDGPDLGATSATWRGRDPGFGVAYTLSGIWKGGSGGGGGGGTNEWTSHYDYSEAPRISLKLSPDTIAVSDTAEAKVTLHGGTDETEYTVTLTGVDPEPTTEPVAELSFPDGNSVTLTTSSRSGTKKVRGDSVGYAGVQASSSSAQNSPVIQPVTVIGVEKLQYYDASIDDDVDAPSVLYVSKGTTLTFRAIPNPNGEEFPSGKPEWSGSSGAAGTGSTVEVTFDEVSTTANDYKTVTADCGNSVTANVIVYEVNSLTVSDASDPALSLTVPDDGFTTLWLAAKDGSASANIDIACTPDVPEVREQVRWQVVGNTADKTNGNFSTVPVVKLTPTGGNDTFTVNTVGTYDGLLGMTVKVVDLQVTNVHIRLKDKAWKDFGTDDGEDATFDPFYDDEKIGGHENFDITDGAWDATIRSDANAQAAASNSHTAKVTFDLSVQAHCKMAVYLDTPFAPSLVAIGSGQRHQGSRLSFNWDITNHRAGDYYAYVGAYVGNTATGAPDYVEVGLKPDEAPSSPRDQNSGRRKSPDFTITRKSWGIARNISIDSAMLTAAEVWTPAQWDYMVQYPATYGVPFLQGVLQAKGIIPGTPWNSLVTAIAVGAVLNQDILDNHRPFGPWSGLLAGDSLDVIDWREAIYEWKNTSGDLVSGQYVKHVDTHYTYVDFHSNPSHYVMSTMDSMTYNTTYDDGSTTSGWLGGKGDLSIYGASQPYIWPPVHGTDMVFDP